MLLENYSGGRGIGKSGLVETVHVCSSRRRDKCSAYCLLWKLRLGSEPGKTRFTIFIRIIYITQLGHPLFRTPPLGAINRKDVIKKIKITLVDLKKNCARRRDPFGATPMAPREYASSSYRYLAFLRPERRGEEEISHSLPLPFVIFRRFHASGQLRSPGPLDGCSTL